MSMMMESWADHCSSDEEELQRVPSASAFAVIPDQDDDDFEDDQSDVGLDTSNHDNNNYQQKPFFNQQPQRPLPNSPPYTAFMNNLIYDVTEEELASEVKKMCLDKFNKKINVLSVRFAKDRETKKRKGFGYVEVETRDDLATMLELNPTSMFGRNVRIDVAQNTRSDTQRQSQRNNVKNNSFHGKDRNPISRSSSNSFQQMNVPDGIDGSKFRGGTIRRSTSKGSTSSLQNKDKDKDTSDVKEDVKSRPRLNLKPRSKPLVTAEPSGAQSSIFGSGRKRDEQSYAKTKDPEADTKEPVAKTPQTTSPKNGDKVTTKSPTTNKPAGRGKKTTNTRSSFTKEGSKKYENNNAVPASNGSTVKKNKRASKKTILVKEDGWVATATSESVPENNTANKVETPANDEVVKAKTNEVKNKFAALGFDDDDSSSD